MRAGALSVTLAGFALLMLSGLPAARGGDDIGLPWKTVLEAERLRKVSDAICRLQGTPERTHALERMKDQGLLPIGKGEIPTGGPFHWEFEVGVGPSVRDEFRRGDRLGDIRTYEGALVHVALLFDENGRARAKSWAVGDAAPVEMPLRPEAKTPAPGRPFDFTGLEPQAEKPAQPLPAWLEQRKPVPGAEDDFVRVAKALDFLQWDDVVYGRDIEVQPPARHRGTRNQVVLSWLLSVPHPTAALDRLARHAHPRVRTLALAALAQSDDPRVLAIAYRLRADDAATFGRPARWSIPGGMDIRTVPLEATTVRDVAIGLLDRWMESAGHPVRFDAWPAYWQARSLRSHCAGWVAWRLTRARLASSPIPASRHERIRALFAEVQQLPTPDRELTTLAVFDEEPVRAIVGEQAYLAAGPRLGLERLRALARGEVLTDDPDFQPDAEGRPSRYQGVVRRILLQNADRWLGAGDADLVLALGRALESPLGAVKAGALVPARARALLEAAWATPWRSAYHGSFERFEIIKGMWSQLGEGEAARVVDWYFDEYDPDLRASTPVHDLPVFLLGRGETRDLRLLKTVILDERFDRVRDEMTIVYLTMSLNEFLGTKLGGTEHLGGSDVRTKEARWRGILRATMREHPRFADLKPYTR